MLGMVGLGTVAWGVTGGDGEVPSPPRVSEQAPPPLPLAVANTPAMPAAKPRQVSLPSLDVKAPIMDLGLQRNGELEVPPGAERAGYYAGAPTPGEMGPAIIAAHVDWSGERGPFYNLAELRPGDRVRVDRADGSTAVFGVTRVEQYDKDTFPTKQVYGNLDHAGLRLITCGGPFVESADSYEDNIVAYARLVAAQPTLRNRNFS